VATVVADRAAERVARLVYLDAPIPNDGQCLIDLIAPAQAAEFHERARVDGDGWRVAPNSPAALGIDDPADAAWVATRLTPQPLATFTRPIRLTGTVEGVPRAYIFCTPARPGSILVRFAEQARAASWAYREVAAGHDAMIGAPAATAEALLSLAP
jgi:hypothetical protein